MYHEVMGGKKNYDSPSPPTALVQHAAKKMSMNITGITVTRTHVQHGPKKRMQNPRLFERWRHKGSQRVS
jgi:hypothetical protein